MDQPAHTPPADGVERSDDAPPQLDPAVEDRVRHLLAAAPAPGPMPDKVAQRIETLLNDEVALRVDRGPLTETDHDRAVLAPLIRQRQRPRPLFAIAAVAAAAAVVAVGGSALHLNKRANGVASLGSASATVRTPTPPPITPTVTPSGDPSGSGTIGPPVGPTKPNLHIQLSTTNYTAGTLADLARAMLTRPDVPIGVLAAEAPTLGPIATEVGLESCLRAHSLPTDVPVHVDLATYDGEPAAVIVVTQDGTSTVRVVGRACQVGNPALVADATPVP